MVAIEGIRTYCGFWTDDFAWLQIEEDILGVFKMQCVEVRVGQEVSILDPLAVFGIAVDHRFLAVGARGDAPGPRRRKPQEQGGPGRDEYPSQRSRV